MKIAFYLFMALYILSAFGSISNGDLFQGFLSLLATVSLWFTYRLTTKVLALGNNNNLNNGEKTTVILTELANPLISWAFYYYGWKEKLPTKAKQANKYGLIIAGIYIGAVVLYVLGIILGLVKV